MNNRQRSCAGWLRAESAALVLAVAAVAFAADPARAQSAPLLLTSALQEVPAVAQEPTPGSPAVAPLEPAPAPPAAPVAPEAPAEPVAFPGQIDTPEPATQAVDSAEAQDEGIVPMQDSGFNQGSWSRPVVRIGQDFHLPSGERVREVVVVFGSARISGEVDRDVVVTFGSVRLESTAVVRGSLVVTGGGVTVDPGAVVNRDMVVTGGTVDAAAGFVPGREYVVVGLPGMGRAQADAVIPWFTRGLLWGRLIVPWLPWLWVVIAMVVLVYLAINVLFDRAVRSCQQTIADRPLSAFLIGLLVLVLIGPVSFILSVSIIGIPVVPFLACGMLIAALLGKVGVTRWIGSSVVPERDPDNRAESIRSFAIGTAIILLAYMVPVVGILVWALGSTIGLGAATLAFSSGLRRENPAARRHPVPPATQVPPSVVPDSPVTPSSVTYAAPPAPSLESDLSVDAGATEADAEPAGQVPVPPPPADPFTAPPPFVPPAAPAGRAPTPPAPRPPGGLLAMSKAPFLDRLAAFALDILLVSVTYHLLDMNGARAFFTLLLAYHIVFWSLKATTVGGIICNLRVVRTDGTALTFADALIRGFSSIFSIAAFGIGCFWILYDPDNQAWHDRFAGTYVVKVPRGWPV